MPRFNYRWDAVTIRDRSPDHPHSAWSTKNSQLQRRFSVLLTVTIFLMFFLLAAIFAHPTPREYAKTAAKTAMAKLPNIPLTSKLDPMPAAPVINEDMIPNNVNFVYALNNSAADFQFNFRHFLSVYSTLYHFKPTAIYLHTNAAPAVLERARTGEGGVWAQRMFALPGFKTIATEMLVHAHNGKDLANMEHRCDFMKVKAGFEHGGVFVDFDAVALRDIAPLRRMGFAAVGGRELGGTMNSGTFLTMKYGTMVKLWRDRMNKVYDGTRSSNRVLAEVCGRLVGHEPGECLIMDREAFSPYSSKKEDLSDLFGVYAETKSALDGVRVGGTEAKVVLPEFREKLEDRWEGKVDWPEWARDWSGTYLMHGFHLEAHRKRGSNGVAQRYTNRSQEVEGVEHITPRYVLERQSNYARAAYPVVRDMYLKGLIEIDDTFDGR